MDELMQILRAHAQHYDKMQPRDAVKLIYQNEFGGGHFISDEAACLAYLSREYAKTPKDPSGICCEDIGNDTLRVHLAALPEDRLEALGEAFLRSAASHQGSQDRFLRKLELLRCVCAQGVFSFTPAQLDAYLSEYRQAGYPIVSHSQAYREAYRPAYRVVSKAFADELHLSCKNGKSMV